MAKVEELHRQFGKPGVLRVERGLGGLARICVTGDAASAEIYPHGAHITQFQPRGAAPVLFMSKASLFEPSKPIRGGVPLVFPWFGARAGYPEAPPHGFARIREWNIESADPRSDGSVRVVLTTASDAATLALWPFAFTLRLIVIIGNVLDITLEVRNQSQAEMIFEEALHTYLKVSDIHNVTVEGLDNAQYIDRTAAGQRSTQSAEPIAFTGETDRAYLHTTSPCVVHDAGLSRFLRIEKEGSDTTVVWNPWIAKAKAMPDFGDDEWPQMLCVEAANALECAVKLAPGHTHRMCTRISVSVKA
ncbi:MAG: D-hexose-6-phosphate mutarotase [Planctomycetota bacterium]|nr:D-hexose-6-phosphate mutarotase [Planctomycetota bacterium]